MEELRRTPRALREWERVSAHSHITGLGLKGLKAQPIADGMVGQTEAREAAGIIIDMVKKGRFAGRAILIAGPPGTGKTALALGMAKELGRDVPFIPIAASEIFSTEIKKTEFLTQALRKAIGLRVHEMRRIYEGKVEELNINQEPHPYNPYQKVPESVRLTLRTKKEEKTSKESSFGLDVKEMTKLAMEKDNINAVSAMLKTNLYAATSALATREGDEFLQRQMSNTQGYTLVQMFFMVRTIAPESTRKLMKNLAKKIILKSSLKMAGRGLQKGLKR